MTVDMRFKNIFVFLLEIKFEYLRNLAELLNGPSGTCIWHRGHIETPDEGEVVEVVWLPQGCKALGFNEAESGAQSKNQERKGGQADMNGMSQRWEGAGE